MEILRLIIISLFKHKKRMILIVIQLFLGISSLLIAFNGIGSSLQHRSDIKSLAKLDTIHPYLNNPFSELNNVSTLKKIYNTFKNDSRVSTIGKFENNHFPLNMTSFDGSINLIKPVTFKSNEKNPLADLIIADKQILKMARFKLKSGSISKLITWNNNSKEPIPVIIGASLENSNPIGCTRELPYFILDKNNTDKVIIKKIKVVGIMDSKMYFWSGGQSSISDNLLDNGRIVIMPNFTDTNDCLTYATNILIQLKNPNNNENFIEFIKSTYSKHNIYSNAETLSEELNSYYDRNKVFILSSLLFASLTLILSSFGVIGVVLSSILRRKKEFGIRYAIGSTPKSITTLVVGEIFVLYLFSYFISTIFIEILSKTLLKQTPLKLNIASIFFALGSTVFFMILATLVPLYKITKTKPVDLINERGV